MQEQGIIQGVQIALGTGVIRPDDGSDDVTFGRDALLEGDFEELREGQAVSFEFIAAPTAPVRRQARHVRLVID